MLIWDLPRLEMDEINYGVNIFYNANIEKYLQLKGFDPFHGW